ncbi:MAG: hypothetical protein NTW95_04210 [Candidatus Aminicenantes bacterium]|nr:hypothetical protein [Candidatus Aminicenantes bacterium]
MKTVNERYYYQRVVLRAAWFWALLILPLIAPAADPPKAEVFAPGVISLPQRIEFCLTMSPDEQEIFFTVRKAPGQWEIHRARRKGNAWQPSKVAPFSGVYSDSEPTLSPDNKRLFFSSNRPRQGKTPADNYDIWVAERQGAGWAAPWPLPEPVNGPGDQWRASQSLAGNLYYSSRGLWRISMDDASALSLVKLFDPQKPGALVGGHAFVAPDESFLLTAWMDGPGGKGGFDIYVSFRDPQGNWGPSLNLGDEVNSAAEEDFPLVSPNGRDLFFFRYQKDGNTESGDIFRIDASILDALRAKSGSR